MELFETIEESLLLSPRTLLENRRPREHQNIASPFRQLEFQYVPDVRGLELQALPRYSGQLAP
jgi:hypothetical protein